jgi:chorismate synthase
MAGNTFGEIFKVTTFGESHGPAIGGVIDGCPAGLKIDQKVIMEDLLRRRPGQSDVTTERKEDDAFEILSGVYEDTTTGSPIAFLIRNKDYKPSDYNNISQVFRPSHADYTYHVKYGIRDHRGGGRSSARETAARVFAGSIARQLLMHSGVTIDACVTAIGHISIGNTPDVINREDVEKSIVRCPDETVSQKMISYLQELKSQGDSTGGIIKCIVKNCPPALGEPVFDRLHADLGKAMLSINACHGFEYGSGFSGAAMKGSEHNDSFVNTGGKISTSTNFSGGIQGGISNGMDIYFRVAFKPVSTIKKEQQTVDAFGNEAILQAAGRHDPCVVPRAVPIVEAMAALVIADHYLRNRSSRM